MDGMSTADKRTYRCHCHGLAIKVITIATFLALGCFFTVFYTNAPVRSFPSLSIPVPSLSQRRIIEDRLLGSTRSEFRHFDRLKDWLPNATNSLPNYFTTAAKSPAEQVKYRDGVIVFNHVNKAAGTSTKSCLHQLVSESGRSLGPVLTQGGRKRLEIKLDNGRLLHDTLMGGYAFGICDSCAHLSCTCSYFTFLRDPYERVISSFTYCQKRWRDQTCSSLGPPKDTSLREWAIFQGSYFFRQLLLKPWFCRKQDGTNTINVRNFSELSGIPESSNQSFANASCWLKEKFILRSSLTSTDMDDLLQYCVDHLEDWFAVIGLTQEYDLSLAMLERVYGLPFVDRCKGRTSNRSQKLDLSIDGHTWTNETSMTSHCKAQLQKDKEVQEALRADQMLYERALDIFKRQKEVFLQYTSAEH
ncbi:uncharacterized protein [Diadema antillarum]|uniref:uncharacterized protein n=1 Tax=Diadema antillarum TaxID=105358 RepID=UPI003A84C9AD